MDDIRRDLQDIRLGISNLTLGGVAVAKMRFIDVYPNASRDLERFKNFFVNLPPVKEHWQDAARIFEEMRIAWPDIFGPVVLPEDHENGNGNHYHEVEEGGRETTTDEKREDGGEVMVVNVAEGDGWEVVEKDELLEWQIEEFVR